MAASQNNHEFGVYEDNKFNIKHMHAYAVEDTK